LVATVTRSTFCTSEISEENAQARGKWIDVKTLQVIVAPKLCPEPTEAKAPAITTPPQTGKKHSSKESRVVKKKARKKSEEVVGQPQQPGLQIGIDLGLGRERERRHPEQKRERERGIMPGIGIELGR